MKRILESGIGKCWVNCWRLAFSRLYLSLLQTPRMGHSQVVRCWYLVVLVLQNIFYNKNVTMLKIICFYSTMISLDMMIRI